MPNDEYGYDPDFLPEDDNPEIGEEEEYDEDREDDREEYYEDLSGQYHEEQNELNESDDFYKVYGFEHHCRCADDWDEGNLGVVSVCFLNMCTEAMEHLKARVENERILRAQNAQFRVMLVEAGYDPDAA